MKGFDYSKNYICFRMEGVAVEVRDTRVAG